MKLSLLTKTIHSHHPKGTYTSSDAETDTSPDAETDAETDTQADTQADA